VPDVMLATLDYPESEEHPAFNVLLRVNFKSGLAEESFGVKFIGSEGVMSTNFTGITVDRSPQPDQFDGAVASFANDVQKQLKEEWDARHATADSRIFQQSSESYDTGAIDAQLEHHRNFYRSIRDGRPSVEDATFGLRAAGPALLTNESLFQRKVMLWDPVKMTIATS
jgi:hypothetical protein